MDAITRETFREATLQVLEPTNRFGLPLSPIKVQLSIRGFRKFSDADVEEALDYLVGKGLAEEAAKQISRENRAWRITAAGRAYLDERGL